NLPSRDAPSLVERERELGSEGPTPDLPAPLAALGSATTVPPPQFALRTAYRLPLRLISGARPPQPAATACPCSQTSAPACQTRRPDLPARLPAPPPGAPAGGA